MSKRAGGTGGPWDAVIWRGGKLPGARRILRDDGLDAALQEDELAAAALLHRAHVVGDPCFVHLVGNPHAVPEADRLIHKGYSKIVSVLEGSFLRIASDTRRPKKNLAIAV